MILRISPSSDHLRPGSIVTASPAPFGHHRDDLLAVGGQRGVLGVVLQVDGELVHTQFTKLLQPPDLLADRAEQAEAIDDLVGHEGGVRVARSAVLVVVVALATLDVVGEGGGYGRRSVVAASVASDDVGDMVADHPTEPAALVARVF